MEQTNIDQYVTCDKDLNQTGAGPAGRWYNISGGATNTILDFEAGQYGVQSFKCPSTDSEARTGIIWGIFMTTYGVQDVSGSFGGLEVTDYCSNAGYVSNADPWKHLRGPFTERSKETFGSISDGTSNVVSFVEVVPFSFSNESSDRYAYSWFGASNTITGFGTPNRKHADGRTPYAGPSSKHPGGIGVTYCDGSSHFLKDTINWWPEWLALTAIADGMVTEAQ